ncbi:hypothetical protein [Adhaeribacter terreus]|uniref:SIMPL domain-containing protein n=1 Tax=Adhaeribacter terreus TaxID=529703 RepID=A0ABW0E9C7_9BACT
MKALKKFALLGLVAPLLFSLLSFTNVGGGEIVTIRMYGLGFSDPRIVVSSKEKSTEIQLERFKNNAAENKNMELLSRTLEQHYKEGYKIETSDVAFINGTGLISTYILTK